jgi:hypothetical protein
MNSTILFMGASPRGFAGLERDAEIDAIRRELDAIRRELKDAWRVPSFTIVPVTPTLDELRHKLRQVNPTIVHFAGHGFRSAFKDIPSLDRPAAELPDDLRSQIDQPRHGLILMDRNGRPAFVSADALAQTFAVAGTSVRLVVLDSCYSRPLARTLVSHVDCAIGTDGAIGDRAALSLAVELYRALGNGKPIAAAVRWASAAGEATSDGAQLQIEVRHGVDASQLVLAEDHPARTGPARTGPSTEAMLDAFTARTPPDELRPIAYFLGECVARRQRPTLARFHARARQLRRASEPGSWHRGFADSLTAYLDGYFAEVEPAMQREQLAREVADHALWREILYALRDDRALNQVAIGEQVGAHASGVASSKSAISVALEDLRVRELVEYVPGEADRRERIHSLTMRGRELLADPVVASALMAAVRGDIRAHSTMDDGSNAAPVQRSPKPSSPREDRRPASRASSRRS